ncbi:hypothetical protein ZZ1p0042 [Acinetobacter phage ZZ1]|jgi:hypothetical protein|uniref:Uncharacterized protein n=2 Tax=Caudoviricetes TaxID=2731619 RepID=W0B4F6_9CAUD|nr:hypothetical protein ZZ1p0042 [Acinetobacter phage ZZ1]AHE63467.1 hypothetical protein ZZ1p0042 [Acinetobacter phage ZZ1]
MAKKETVQVTEFNTSKRGKIRDPKATMKLSLELGFARTKRLLGK